MGTYAPHRGRAGAQGDEGMPAERKAEHGRGSTAAAEPVAQPGKAGVAGQSLAKIKGMDGNPQGLEFRPEVCGLIVQTQQFHQQALVLPVSGQLKSQLGAAFGGEGAEDDQQITGLGTGYLHLGEGMKETS